MNAKHSVPSVSPVSSVVKGFALVQAESPTQLAQARERFDKELVNLPGDYAPPDGRLLLAHYDAQLAACAALHKLDPGICEMKRLYLRPQFRGKGLGRTLADRIIAEARQIGYQRMRLDTVEPVMKDAVAMYRKIGFREIASYRVNPMPGTIYMELLL